MTPAAADRPSADSADIPPTAPAVLCPECWRPLGPLAAGATEAGCPRGHWTPVFAGILDCRASLTGFDLEADRHLAEELAAMTSATFEQRLRHYWGCQPDVSSDRRERFVRGDLIAEDRAREVAGQIVALTGAPLTRSALVLEVGCGTAALSAALAADGAAHVVATDVSLAWLVLARARIEHAALRGVQLVAATADRLPFADRSFDLVVAADVVEHVPDVAPAVDDCFRVLGRGGHLWLSTPNRFSPTPEPHVRLLGIGFLPVGSRSRSCAGCAAPTTRRAGRCPRPRSDVHWSGPEAAPSSRTPSGPRTAASAGASSTSTTWSAEHQWRARRCSPWRRCSTPPSTGPTDPGGVSERSRRPPHPRRWRACRSQDGRAAHA